MRAILAFSAALAVAFAGPGEPAPPPAGPVARTGPAVESRVEIPDTLTTAARASLGSEAFATRGCAACHTIGGGPRVGPDLAGVTTRRDPEWFRAMVTEPDSMLRHDPVARELHARYAARMPDLGVAPGEAGALWTFLALSSEPSAFADADPATGPVAGPSAACPGVGPRAGQRGPRPGHGRAECGHGAGRGNGAPAPPGRASTLPRCGPASTGGARG